MQFIGLRDGNQHTHKHTAKPTRHCVTKQQANKNENRQYKCSSDKLEFSGRWINDSRGASDSGTIRNADIFRVHALEMESGHS